MAITYKTLKVWPETNFYKFYIIWGKVKIGQVRLGKARLD